MCNPPAVRVDKTPGASFRYSGGGYLVVQQARTDLTGMPFDTFVERSVLDRLQMAQTTFAQQLPADKLSAASAAHDARGRAIPSHSHVYPELAAAGLWTTPQDLALFLIELMLPSMIGRTDFCRAPSLKR